MKDIKSLIALSTAVLCMGMGMTVSAETVNSDASYDSPYYLDTSKPDAWNPDWAVQPVQPTDGVGEKNLDLVVKDLSFEAKKIFSDEGKIAEIFVKNGYQISNDIDMKPIYAGNFVLNGDDSGTAFFSVEADGVRAGDTVYIMRETQDGLGTFEVLEGEIDPDGKIHFHVEGAGNFLILTAVSSDGKVVAAGKEGSLTVNPGVKRDQDNKADMKRATVKDANGNEVETGVHVSELKSDIEQLINDNFEVIFDDQYHYPKNENSNIELVYKGEFDRTDDGTGTVRMYFAVEDESEEIYYYALHGITDVNGEVQRWEIIECRKDDKTGQMYFELNSFSPVAVIKVMSDQKPALAVPADTAKPGGSGSSSSAKKSGSAEKQEITAQRGAAEQPGTTVRIHSLEKTSPKTGEF